MNKAEQSDIATVETARANLAEWRARAIRTVSKGFSHMMAAYEGNDAVLEQVGALREQFKILFGERPAKLDAIASESRDKAARAVSLMVENE